LGPLIVHGADWALHIDRLFYSFHNSSLCVEEFTKKVEQNIFQSTIANMGGNAGTFTRFPTEEDNFRYTV
jgi:hypothetical protein